MRNLVTHFFINFIVRNYQTLIYHTAIMEISMGPKRGRERVRAPRLRLKHFWRRAFTPKKLVFLKEMKKKRWRGREERKK